MRIPYIIALVIFALGLGLLVFGTTGTNEVTLFGLTFHPRIAKGVGIITMIFSAIAFLAAFGHAQSPTHAERKG
ncbi:MAG: hypothetical protein AB1671_22380 [Thermodesulfobacteriota bacterium]|jgi:hypothetical protein